jgi:hypothetical protein
MEESEIKRHTLVDPATLRTLVDHRLLRADQTVDGTYYELSHDSLIQPVLGSRRSLAFLAGWHLFVGIVGLFFGGLYLAMVPFMPLAYFFSESRGSEGDWFLLMITPFSALLGWIFWRGGVRNIKKFKDMRRRLRISRRTAPEIEGRAT